MKCLLVCACLTIAGCARPTPQPDLITVALANSPANLDPGVGVDESSQKLHQLLYSSLMKIDASLRVVPDLATRFETHDWQTFLAAIPPGVLFHDGREMTSADVAFTFRRFLDAKFASARRGAYRDLESVDVVDRYSVAFHLKRPSSAFPVSLVMGIVPEGSGATLARRPMGSGPYQIGEFVPDDHVTLTGFSRAYGGPPATRTLIFRVVPDETMRGLELRKGSVDIVVNDLSPDMVHTLEDEGRLQVVRAPGTDYAYVGFNLRDPVLADVRVRQAIGYAIDRKAIITYLRRGLALESPGIVPSMSWAFESRTFQFTYDPGRAGALLDQAGYRDPDGPGPAPRLRLTLKTSTAEAYRVQAAVIQQQLSLCGIAIDLRSYEFATLMDDVRRGNVQLYTLQFVGVTDPDMLRRAFHSSQVPPDGFNRGHYLNAGFDQVVDRATASLDEGERRRLYGEAQAIIARDAPYISLWTKTNIAVAQPDIRGIELSAIADFGFLRRLQRAVSR
jgi:peptide/nickel transport system substrate-binding protein